MRNSQNIKDLVELNPDYIGFIFYEKSPRHAGNTLKSEIKSLIPDTIKKTGVFVNSTPETIFRTCDKYQLNTVQLHGNESIDLCRQILDQGYKVIKAFSLKSEADIEKVNTYSDCCNYFLFDTPTVAYGGSGQKFDWSILRLGQINRPFFLSGGIEESDANTILKTCPIKPFAIDINSRFEIAPGLKNIESVKRFIETIHNH